MAGYKRTSYYPNKSNKSIRATITRSTNGNLTTSKSVRVSSNMRITNTTKSNGQMYTTVTKNLGNGYYERKRTHSFTPKRPKYKKEDIKLSPKFLMWLGIFVLVVYISNLF